MAAAEAARAARAAAIAAAAAAPPPEEAEALWRRLEAAGVLVVTRGADALPRSVSLGDGGAEWSGELPDACCAEHATAASSGGRVTVRLIDGGGGGADGGGMALRGWTKGEGLECGFCRYMRAGPCGRAFKAWELCIDRARDTEGVDFVELCGTQTLALKDCTDAHPEYYGEIAPKDEPEAPPEEAAAAASS